MTIYDLARTNLPDTWDVIANNSSYGQTLLQSKVDFVKYRVFSTIVNSTVESSVYNPIELNYAAKLTALEVIPIAYDHYKNIRQTITTSGTRETVSYPDRIAALQKLSESLTKDVMALALELPKTSGVKRRVLGPKFDSADWRTLDPKKFPKKDDQIWPPDTYTVWS